MNKDGYLLQADILCAAQVWNLSFWLLYYIEHVCFPQILGDFALFSMNGSGKTSEEDLVTKSRHSSSEVLQT